MNQTNSSTEFKTYQLESHDLNEITENFVRETNQTRNNQNIASIERCTAGFGFEILLEYVQFLARERIHLRCCVQVNVRVRIEIDEHSEL